MKALFLIAISLIPGTLWADPAVIENIFAEQRPGSWNFSVTLRHPDTGWDHYADGWEVLSSDEKRLGYRELLHPHETEQPFTRSLGGVEIPRGTEAVLIRAKCSVDGWTSALYEVSLIP